MNRYYVHRREERGRVFHRPLYWSCGHGPDLRWKLVTFDSFSVPAGVIVFSISFLVTDAPTEFWDRKTAMKAVFGGFLASLLLILGIWIVLRWDHPEF